MIDFRCMIVTVIVIVSIRIPNFMSSTFQNSKIIKIGPVSSENESSKV